MSAWRAWVAVGANVGDRAGAIARALDALEAGGDVRVVRRSRLYETEPVGAMPQGSYLNGVVEVEVGRDAAGDAPEAAPRMPGMPGMPGMPAMVEAFGEKLMAAEAAAGRVRAGEVRWGARVVDLDLLMCGASGEVIVRGEQWTVPHPRMHERAFVLVPLRELAPDLVHPLTRRTVAELAAAVDAAGVRPAAGSGVVERRGAASSEGPSEGDR